MYMGEGRPLRLLTSDELQAEMNHYRRQQRNSRTRRRERAMATSIDTAAGAGRGLSVRATTSVIAFPDDFLLQNLSARQIGQEDEDPVGLEGRFLAAIDSGTQTEPSRPPSPVFDLPLNMTETEVADFLAHFQWMRPTSLVDLLAGWQSSPIPLCRRDELRYWFTVIALQQRRFASALLDDVRGALARVASGQEAFLRVSERLEHLSRRPLDSDD